MDTPLFLALENRYTEIAKMLIDKGANVNAMVCTNKYSPLTPLEFAKVNGYSEDIIREMLVALRIET
jgi:ankyrin repeat protein